MNARNGHRQALTTLLLDQRFRPRGTPADTEGRQEGDRSRQRRDEHLAQRLSRSSDQSSVNAEGRRPPSPPAVNSDVGCGSAAGDAFP